MPIKNCSVNNKPGYKWGNGGHCYTYAPNDAESRKEAKKKAIKQGVAIEGPEKFKKIMEAEGSEYIRDLLEDDELTDQEFECVASTYSSKGNIQEQLLFAQFVEARRLVRKENK
jgi:hypothetical protein